MSDPIVTANEVKLNDLNLKEEPESSKFAPGVMSAFLDGQVDIMDFGISHAKKYTDYGVKFSRSRNPDLDRANNQSTGEKALHALGRIGLEGMIGEGVSGVGSLLELASMAFTEGETDFNNSIIELGSAIKAKSQDAMPIYARNPGKSWQVKDFAWWAENSVSVGSTLGLLIPATGLTKGFSLAGKTLAKLGKAEVLAAKTGKLAKGLSKALQIYDTTGAATKYWGKVIGTSVAMRHAENFGESLQTYNNTKQESKELFNTMDDSQFEAWKIEHKDLVEGSASDSKQDISNHIANKAGWQTYKADASNLIFDIVQVMPLFKGFKYNTRTKLNPKKVLNAHMKSMGSEVTGKMAKAAFRQRLGNAIVKGTVAQQLSEGVEETINAISQQEGNHYGKQLLGTDDGSGFGSRLASYLQDPATWEQAFWGVMGGVAFSGGTAGLNKTRNIIKGIPNDRADEIRVGEITGREVELVKGATLMDAVNHNINPYTSEIITGTAEEIANNRNKIKGDIIADVALQLGIGASRHANVNLLLEHVQSDLFKKELVEKYKLSDTEEVNDIVSVISDNVLKAETLYKNYYNKFATADIKAPIKDLLISDAIWLEQAKSHIQADSNELTDKLSNLKATTGYKNIADIIDKQNEGSNVETAKDLDSSITGAAIDQLLEYVLDDILSTSNPESKAVLVARFNKYKQLLDKQKKELTNVFTTNELLRKGVDQDIINTESELLLNNLHLMSNADDITTLLSNTKQIAKDKEDAMRKVVEKKTQEQLSEISKAIDDADTEAELKSLKSQTSKLAKENQLFKKEYNNIKNKIDSKLTNIDNTRKRAEATAIEKKSYIESLKNSKGTNLTNLIAKRKNKAFVSQFNEADLTEIDDVLAELAKTSKPPVDDESTLKLGEEFITFITSIVRPTISSFSPIYISIADKAATVGVGGTIELTNEHFSKLEQFRNDLAAIQKTIKTFESLGSVFVAESAKIDRIINELESNLQDKIIINIEDSPAPTPTTEGTITKDELVAGIKTIAANFNAYKTLKSDVAEGDAEGKATVDRITHAVSIIRLLALHDANLKNTDILVNSNYPFTSVLEFINSEVDSELLRNPSFVDTLKNVYNILVNDGTIDQSQYVEGRVDVTDILAATDTDIELADDTGVFISSLARLKGSTRKDGDLVVTNEEEAALLEIMNLEIGDTVEVGIDEALSGKRSTDSLQADVKVTHNGITLFHLNRLYKTESCVVSYHAGMPYTGDGNWTNELINIINSGGFVNEFKLIKSLKALYNRNGKKGFTGMLDNYGESLVNSDIIKALVNYNRAEPISRIDTGDTNVKTDKAAFDAALLHIVNIVTHGSINDEFSAIGIKSSLTDWSNRITADIANTLKLRKALGKAGITISVPISHKTSGNFIKATNKFNKPMYKHLDATFGNVDDMVLLHTTSDRTDVVETVNGKDTVRFNGKFHKGTIYTIAKTSTVNGVDTTVVPAITTDVTDERLSAIGNAYNEKLVNWAVASIAKLTNANTYTNAEFLELVNNLNSKLMGISKNTSTKGNAMSFRANDINYTITINKTITSVFINGKKVFGSDNKTADGKPVDYTVELSKIFYSLKRNLPISKVNGKQTMEQYNSTNNNKPVYVDVVTNKEYPSFTHYAVATELLITEYAAVKNKKGKIISNTAVDGNYSINDGQRMIVRVDGNQATTSKSSKETPKETPKDEPKDVKPKTTIQSIISNPDSKYKYLYDAAIKAGATFDETIVDTVGFGLIDAPTLRINVTGNFEALPYTSKELTLAHEAIHAITLNRITEAQREQLLDIDDDLRAAYERGELDAILTEAEIGSLKKLWKAIEGSNGQNIGDEVLTYAFTNTIYAKALNSIKSDINGSNSLWDKFLNLITTLLEGTKLADVRNIMNEIMGIENVNDTNDSDDMFNDLQTDSQDDFDPLDDFDNDEFNSLIAEEPTTSLGSTVVDYIRTKSKTERALIRTEINNGTIVFNCK